ncbi:acyl-CoA N-acyltransferase [Marasmius fiardii PR-910]|nr:acyl-CoA N-acyltransferase [Marasmius fiardii PR-910]
MMEGYCEQCLREDLKDITAHYRLEPKNSDNGHHESEYKPTKSSCFWVAEQKSDSGTGYEVVGCIALDAPDAPSVGELRRLSVLPNQRGKGIGSLLIRTVIAFAKEQKNLSSLRLTTSTFQPDGIRLYTRYGWKNTEMKAYKGNVMESLFYLVTMEYYDL